MQIDPRIAQAWVQLLVLDMLVLLGAIVGLWRWLIGPVKSAVAEERESRKAADAHRDERTRELRDKMQSAIGRVEVLERQIDTANTDRQSLHSEVDEIRTTQANETERLRDAEKLHERTFGELKTAMAQMENRINDTVRAAIKEAASMNRGTK